MVTKIITTLQDKRRTTRSRVMSLIGDEIMKTKYDDIGKSKQVLKSLKEMEKVNPNLTIIDKTRIGIVIEEHVGKTEKQLVDVALKQANDVIKTLEKEDGGIRSDIEIFKEVDGKWIKK